MVHTLFTLKLHFNFVYGVREFDFEDDGFASQHLDEDLHTTTEMEDQVKGGLILDDVLGEGVTILELSASKCEAILVQGDTFLHLNIGLDVINDIRRLNLESDRLAGGGLYKDLQIATEAEDQVEGGYLSNAVFGWHVTTFKLLFSKDETLLIRGGSIKGYVS